MISGVEHEKCLSIVSVVRACGILRVMYDVKPVCEEKSENVSSVCVGDESVDCYGLFDSACNAHKFDFVFLYIPMVLKGVDALYSSLRCKFHDVL